MSELIGVFPIQFVIKTKIKQAKQFRMCAIFFLIRLFFDLFICFFFPWCFCFGHEKWGQQNYQTLNIGRDY